MRVDSVVKTGASVGVGGLGEPELKQLRVLYVDDYAMARKANKRLFADYYTDVDTASNASEALEKFGQNSFDVVVSDIQMPGMNGFELANKIKEINPKTVVILVTANRVTVDECKALPENVDAVLDRVDFMGTFEGVVNRLLEKRVEKK